MYSYPSFSESQQIVAIKRVRDYLPDDARLGLLAFTGSRAFGWGGERHDFDLHGFFEKEDWFNRCHGSFHRGDDYYDMTVENVYDFENPDAHWTHFKQYYDKSNPIFVHEAFDYEGFMDRLTPDHVLNVFPYDIQLQMSRMDNEFHDRAALHTYKELMIPLYYLEEGVVETNVVEVQNFWKYDCEGLRQCVRSYRDEADVDIDEALVREEVEWLYDRLEQAVIEHTSYEP